MKGQADLQQPEGQDPEGYGGYSVAVSLALHVLLHRQYGWLKHPAPHQSFFAHQVWQLWQITMANALSEWQEHKSMLHSLASLFGNCRHVLTCKPAQALTSLNANAAEGKQVDKHEVASLSVCVSV